MARVKIPIAVIDPNGTAVQGASVSVKKRSDGSNAVLYQAETGPTTVNNPTATDAVGRVQAWVDRGSYNATISGTGIATYTQAFEAGPASDRSVDSFWLPIGVDAPLLGALPNSPVDGQRIYYLADASNGIIWTLRYRAYALDGVTANPSPYKWEVLGSPTPLVTTGVAATNASLAPSTWVDINSPVSVTVPLAGDYDVDARSGMQNFTSGGHIYMGVRVGATDPTPDVNTGAATQPSAGQWVNATLNQRIAAVPAATVLTLRYRHLGTNPSNLYRGSAALAVTPIRVG